MEIHPSRHFLTALGLFLITVGLCGVFAGGHVYVRDGAAMYMMSASIVDHHWFDVDSSHPNTVGGRFGPDGKYYMPFGYLQPLLATPFFMVGRKLAETFQTDYISFFAVTVFNWCVTGMLAGAMFMGFLRMGVAPRKAAGGGLASVFATPFWVYSQTFFSEPLTALLGVLAWLSMIRYRSTGHLRDVFLSAVFAGLIPSIRPLGSLLIPPLLLYLLLILKTKYPSPNSRFPVRSLAVFILPIAAGILGYLAYNAVRFGNVFETGYNRLPDGSLRSFTLNPLFGLKVLLLSPGKSIFVFSPLLLLVPFGVPTLLRKKHTRTDTAVFLLITGLYLAVLSTWARVEGGVAWGPRLILPAIPFLFFCITPVLNSDRNAWRRLVILLAAVGVAIQLTGVLFNFSTYVYQHIDGYFSPVDGRYVISFNPVPGHVRSILETVSHRGSFQSRPDAQAAWNRSSEQINPMDGLDFWWLHFYRDGVPSRFIVTSLVLLGLILTTGIVLLRTSLINFR